MTIQPTGRLEGGGSITANPTPQLSKRKFRKGRPIRTLAKLVQALEAGRWVFLQHKAYHPAFLEGMTLRSIHWWLLKGNFCLAEPNA